MLNGLITLRWGEDRLHDQPLAIRTIGGDKDRTALSGPDPTDCVGVIARDRHNAPASGALELDHLIVSLIHRSQLLRALSSLSHDLPKDRIYHRRNDRRHRDRQHPRDEHVRATPQRTADTRFGAPTPMMLDEITCVVLTGAFSYVATRIETAAAVSAANPLIGRSLMIRCPIVFMIRQPPAAVPRAIAVAQLRDHPRRRVQVRHRRAPRGRVGGQGQGDDPHRLLGVVRPVGERHEPRRPELQHAEHPVHRRRPQRQHQPRSAAPSA